MSLLIELSILSYEYKFFLLKHIVLLNQMILDMIIALHFSRCSFIITCLLKSSCVSSLQEALEGICTFYEQHLKQIHPERPTITYNVEGVFILSQWNLGVSKLLSLNFGIFSGYFRIINLHIHWHLGRPVHLPWHDVRFKLPRFPGLFFISKKNNIIDSVLSNFPFVALYLHFVTLSPVF